jgi:phosphatidylserine/phosphatidylglycerophosphate/cardiolipin synthase-like enzyme
VIIGAQHNHFVLRARDEAQHRALVVSHKLGPVSAPSIVIPLMAAARQRGIEARVFYGKTRRPMSSRAEGQLTGRAEEGGVVLNAIQSPRLHAKVLAWDDDAIAVSSLNWLSADPTEIGSLNEIGIWIKAPGAAKTMIDDFERALSLTGAK